MLKNSRQSKIAAAVLTILLGISFCCLSGLGICTRYAAKEAGSVAVPENIITPGEREQAARAGGEAQAETETTPSAELLKLEKERAGDNESFFLDQMLPGDEEIRYYCVKVCYRDTVTVRFRADTKKGGEKLAEALQAKVVLLNNGQTLYDGPLGRMPESIDYTLSARESSVTRLYYAVTVRLPAETGNAYAEQMLRADLIWWTGEAWNLESPNTGGPAAPFLFTVLLVLSAALLLLLLKRKARGKARSRKSRIRRRAAAGLVSVILLAAILCVTTLAALWQAVSVENNFFRTGKVRISVNDGKPIIEEHEFLFEPGMRVTKTFTVKNLGTCEAFCRLYFKDVRGGLSEVLQTEIRDGSRLLFRGPMSRLRSDESAVDSRVLEAGEEKELQITFCFPEQGQNTAQDLDLSFRLCADAVQTKNNPNRSFT